MHIILHTYLQKHDCRHGIVLAFSLKIHEKRLQEPIEIGKDHLKLGYSYCGTVTIEMGRRAMFTHFVETNMYVITSSLLLS